MTTAHELLTQLYQSAEMAELKTKWRKEADDRWDDIIQHVFTDLYGRPPDEILDLHQRGKLKWYIVKYLWNVCHYTKGAFRQQYGQRETPTDFCAPGAFEVVRFEEPVNLRREQQEQDEANQQRDELRQEQRQRLRTALSEVHWYKVQVLELYLEMGSYREVSKATGIPTTSVYRTVNDLKNELKKKL